MKITHTCLHVSISNDPGVDQQQCSRLSQKASGHMPNLRSVIHVAPISITPATQPATIPTNKTHNHPDHASWAAY